MFDVFREKDLAGKFAFQQARVECETHEEAVKELAGGNRVVVAGPERYDLVTEGFDLSRVYWLYEANSNAAVCQALEG